MKKNIVILSGAGISAESGIKTFRDADGLWEGHDIMEVASPEGWHKNPNLVLDFYNKRRAQLKTVSPNSAHLKIAAWEKQHHVHVITQNVDNLHEIAGSTNVLHLHGELTKVRSTKDPDYIIHWNGDVTLDHTCPKGGQLRPHIVWFGEAVPALEAAIPIIQQADILLIIGTSMQVYPAASLHQFAPESCTCFYIDPKPNTEVVPSKFRLIAKKATTGIDIVDQWLETLE